MTIKTAVLFFVSGLSLFLAACDTVKKSNDPPPAPGAEMALVYILRSTDELNNRWATNFSVNGRNIVTLNDRNYSYIYLPAGSYSILASSFHVKVRLAMVLGARETYYVEYMQAKTGARSGRNFLRTLQPEEGMTLARRYSYVEASKELTLSRPTPESSVSTLVEVNRGLTIPVPTPELSEATVHNKQDYINYIAALTISQICNDHAMLDKITIPEPGCRENLEPYIPVCNQEMNVELEKWNRHYADYSDVKKLHAEGQVPVYKYCLIEHNRNKVAGQLSK